MLNDILAISKNSVKDKWYGNQLATCFCLGDCLKYFGKPHLAKDTLAEYKQQLIMTHHAFNQAVKEQNPKRVRYLLHRLLSSAIYCGTQKLQRTLSDNLNYTHPIPTQIVVSKINKEIEEVLAAISKFLEKQSQAAVGSL